MCGASIFFWSAIEDNDLTAVLVLGIWLSATLISLWWGNQNEKIELAHEYHPILALMLGAGMGILTSLCIAGLMLFKNLRHSHIFPDYPFEMMRDIVGRAPFWALGSGFMALGMYLLWQLFNRDHDS